MAKIKWLIVGAAFMILFVASIVRAADEDKPAADQVHRFKGKIVMVILESSSALEDRPSSEAIKDAEVEKIGDRYFLTGAVHLSAADAEDSQSEWRRGAKVGIALSSIKCFYLYSPEEFEIASKSLYDEE
jgi:hypothetical protein